MANRSNNVEAEAFLDTIQREMGVSDRFIDAARPAVVRLFTEVPEERRAACIETVRAVFARQAETEKSIARAQETLKQLRGDLLTLFGRLRAVQEEANALVQAAQRFQQRGAQSDAANDDTVLFLPTRNKRTLN